MKMAFFVLSVSLQNGHHVQPSLLPAVAPRIDGGIQPL
jgi:hypothetical protein